MKTIEIDLVFVKKTTEDDNTCHACFGDISKGDKVFVLDKELSKGLEVLEEDILPGCEFAGGVVCDGVCARLFGKKLADDVVGVKISVSTKE